MAQKDTNRYPLTESQVIEAEGVAGKQRIYLGHIRRGGMHWTEALERAGVAATTLRSWRRDYPAFKEQEQDAKARAVGRIYAKTYDKAMKGDVRAQMFLLERQLPDEFAQKQEIAITGPSEIRSIFPRPTRLTELPTAEVDPLEGAFREITYEELESTTRGLPDVPESRPVATAQEEVRQGRDEEPRPADEPGPPA